MAIFTEMVMMINDFKMFDELSEIQYYFFLKSLFLCFVMFLLSSFIFMAQITY